MRGLIRDVTHATMIALEALVAVRLALVARAVDAGALDLSHVVLGLHLCHVSHDQVVCQSLDRR